MLRTAKMEKLSKLRSKRININSRLLFSRLFFVLILLVFSSVYSQSANADTSNTLGHDVRVYFVEKLIKYSDKPQRKIVINIPSRTLTLYEWGLPVKSWPVGLGKSTFKTPVGQFSVLFKIKKPTWVSPYNEKIRIGPGPDNPLGTRWIEFKEDATGDYGIHGTNSPLSVGQFSSHGCVRMRIPDAELLFDKVDVKTPVEITYNQVLSWEKNNSLYIRVYADYYKRGKPDAQTVINQIMTQYPTATINKETLKKALLLANEAIVLIGNIQSE